MNLSDMSGAHSHASHIWNAADIVGLTGTLTSPLWWESVNLYGQILLLAVGLIGGGLRIAILAREWSRGRRP